MHTVTAEMHTVTAKLAYSNRNFDLRRAPAGSRRRPTDRVGRQSRSRELGRFLWGSSFGNTRGPEEHLAEESSEGQPAWRMTNKPSTVSIQLYPLSSCTVTVTTVSTAATPAGRSATGSAPSS